MDLRTKIKLFTKATLPTLLDFLHFVLPALTLLTIVLIVKWTGRISEIYQIIVIASISLLGLGIIAAVVFLSLRELWRDILSRYRDQKQDWEEKNQPNTKRKESP